MLCVFEHDVDLFDFPQCTVGAGAVENPSLLCSDALLIPTLTPSERETFSRSFHSFFLEVQLHL